MYALAAGVFGLIIGSFLNVLVLRRGAKTLGGRSACMACGSPIVWYDNIPVISWLMLRGRCRACGSAISIQYPLVEASTGILFGLIAGAAYMPPGPDAPYALAMLLASCAMAALLVAITVYDLRHTIIPDAWAYSFAALALISALLNPYEGSSIGTALLGGPLAALPFFLLWAISRGRWMGLGDAKLALGIGWLLGPLYGVFAVFFAFILGALVSVPLLFFSSDAWRRLSGFTPTASSQKSEWGFTMKSEIPFGPFLVCSCLLVWVTLMYHIDIVRLLGLW